MKRKLILVLVALLLLILSIAIPAKRKYVIFNNAGDDSISEKNDIPVTGSITNNKELVLSFESYEQLYGIQLFFYTDSKENTGEILWNLYYEDKCLESGNFPIEEILFKMEGSSIKAQEMVFETKPSFEGIYKLVFKGDGLSTKARIGLYSSYTDTPYVVFMESERYQEHFPMFVLEGLKVKHPYTWICTLLLVFFMFVFSLEIDKKEKCE